MATYPNAATETVLCWQPPSHSWSLAQWHHGLLIGEGFSPEKAKNKNKIQIKNLFLQRGFIQQLMEPVVETHSQMLGRAWRILKKRERKDSSSQRGQGHPKETTKSTNLGSEGLTKPESTTREPAWSWPGPSVYMSCLCNFIFLCDS